MKQLSPPNSWLHSLMFGLFILSFVVFQGCDSLSGVDQEPDTVINDREAAPMSTQYVKLRHPEQLKHASRTLPATAGKSITTTTDLFLALNPYEADGLTPRLASRYQIVNRILLEYGITRRVLSKYGITYDILEEFGITRRMLGSYGITKRILEKYGITPRVLSRYSDLISAELLADFELTEDTLASEGLTPEDIEDFNTLTTFLRTYEITFEEFILAVESAESSIRIKIFIHDAHLGMAVAVDNEVLNLFLEEISSDPDILFAEPDVTIDLSELGTISSTVNDQQIVPWGITNIKTPLPSTADTPGTDYNALNPVHVYVLDSGAMPETSLSDLNYVEKKDFTMLFDNRDQLTWDEESAPDVSDFNPDSLGNPYDESGHGTHIAGTIGALNDSAGVVGVAPGVNIHSLKVLTREGQTDITTLLAAIDYVTRKKEAHPHWPIVVNLSLGLDIGTTSYNILDEAIDKSIKKGIIFVAAAGNDAMDVSTYSPAHVDEVITVGSYNVNNFFSTFSNYGAGIDILAPGEDIISLSHVVSEVEANESILTSGTSHATPHVVGAIARYLGSQPNATANEVSKALLAAAEPTISGAPAGTTTLALNVHTFIQIANGSLTKDGEELPDSKEPGSNGSGSTSTSTTLEADYSDTQSLSTSPEKGKKDQEKPARKKL